MQYHYINQNSVHPYLRMELVYDGRYDFLKSSHLYNAIQNADVYFSMWDEHDVLRISKAQCELVLADENTCDERYIIQYKWKPRDVRHTGQFKGRIEIVLKDDLYQASNKVDSDGKDIPVQYDGGNLIVPIYEDLIIMIK